MRALSFSLSAVALTLLTAAPGPWDDPSREERPPRTGEPVEQTSFTQQVEGVRSSPELCVKVRGSSSMLLLGCLGDLLRFEKREIQVATFAPDRSSP